MLKFRLTVLLILSAVLIACTTAEEPAAVSEPAAVAEEAAPVVEEVVEDSAEMAEEEMAEDESYSDDVMADEDESHDDDAMDGDEEESMDDSAMEDAADESMEDETMVEDAMAETVFVVDPAASVLTWTGSKPIGDSHTGTIDLIDGQLVANGETFVSGGFNIDMTTIDDEDGNGRLEGHLKSDDFFGVETFPTASVEIISATPVDAGTFDVVANLTIKEITNEITFPVSVEIVDGALTGTASIEFDRSLWDVRYGSGSFFSDLGNDLIDDMISLEVVLVANG